MVFRGRKQRPRYLLQFSSKHGTTHVNNKHHILLHWLEASGGKVMNEIATIDLGKRKGSQEAR